MGETISAYIRDEATAERLAEAIDTGEYRNTSHVVEVALQNHFEIDADTRD